MNVRCPHCRERIAHKSESGALKIHARVFFVKADGWCVAACGKCGRDVPLPVQARVDALEKAVVQTTVLTAPRRIA